MAGYLLDTNVVSELVRPRPAQRVVDWVAANAADSLHLSAVTLGELIRGAGRLPSGRRHDRLARWVDVDLAEMFGDRVHAFDRQVAAIWGRLMSEGDRKGRPVGAIDAQIAATALRHDLVLATRNVADFHPIGIALVDPWSHA